MNEGIKDIRVLQKYRIRTKVREDGTDFTWKELTTYTIQIKRNSLFADWENVPIVEEEQ